MTRRLIILLLSVSSALIAAATLALAYAAPEEERD